MLALAFHIRACELFPHRPTMTLLFGWRVPNGPHPWPLPRQLLHYLGDEDLPGEGRLPKDASLDLHPPFAQHPFGAPLSLNAWGNREQRRGG